jgi:DNA-binding winged helix-turn-helix (wHTH) protein
LLFRDANALKLAFSDCVLDVGARTLTRAGQDVHLPRKAFRVLEYLIQNRPDIVPKEKLFQEIWPDTHVAEVTLASLIARLRHAIGDSSEDHRLIRTVHGYGYGFCGEIRAEKHPDEGKQPVFRLLFGDRELALPAGRTLLGRDRDCAVFLDDVAVSRHHARIEIVGDAAVIEDLDSKNGTYVNGERITGTVRLSDGAEIQIGSASMTFREFSPKGSTKTSPPQRSPSRRNKSRTTEKSS